MRTNGGNCEFCPLLNNARIKNFSLASDNANVNNPDIFIVTDISAHGREIFDFLKKNYPDKKFFVISSLMCEHNEQTSDVCINCCFPNFPRLSKKINAKNCFAYDIENLDKELLQGFIQVNNIDELNSELKKVYVKKEVKEEFNVSDKYYMFSIPEKYYTTDYCLVDIQYISQDDKVIYIFRDKNNKKEIYEFTGTNYYWYESVSSNRIIENIDNLRLVKKSYKRANREKTAYGGDVNICTKHCVDYFLKSKGEARNERKNTMFFDIETYQYHDNIFPEPSEAKYPIVAISFRTDRKDDFTHVYLTALKGEIDSRWMEVVGKYKHVTVFRDEISMLTAWFSKIQEECIDKLVAYNGSFFDFPYVCNRMHNIGMDERLLSKYGHVFAHTNGQYLIPGLVCLDSLKLYKEFTHGILPSYSLNNVAAHVLGKEKVQHVDKTIDEMYRDDIDLYLKYSTVDTDLIFELEKTLGHCSLQDEIRRVSTCSFANANSTLGQAEGIYQTALKKQGRLSRNYIHDVPKMTLKGAYVFDPRPGIYDGLLCDFDYKSLYPTTICTWNIGPDTFIGQVDETIAYKYLFAKNELKNKKFELILDPSYQNKKMTVTLEQFEKFMLKYKAQITIIGTIFCGHEIHESINYNVLNMLMNSRGVYKKMMLEAKEAGNKLLTVEYNDKQLAFKIIANALYGALGNEHFRFYNPILGGSITGTGREMIMYSAVHADNYMEGKYGDDPTRFCIDPKFMDKIGTVKNIVYGDTDSVFVYLTDYLKKKKLPCAKTPEVLAEVSKIQDYINKIIIPELLRRHHINLDKSQMYLKNEFLMNRYYALNAKKKYASRIIAQEGKDINEIDVKGLEIKRSEIPPRSQKMLKDMLDVILDDKNTKSQIKSKIDKIVKESREDITRLAMEGDVSVSKTVAYSKQDEEYKVVPQHLLGMKTWNCLSGKEDFRYGSKGKLILVNGINVQKAPKEVRDNYELEYLKQFPGTPIKAIVIPENMQKLPDYFIPDFKATVKYACDDRAELLMSGLYTESDNDLLF